MWVSQHPVAEEAPERGLFRQWSPPRRVDIIDSGTGVLRRSFYYHLCRDFTGQVHPDVQGY